MHLSLMCTYPNSSISGLVWPSNPIVFIFKTGLKHNPSSFIFYVSPLLNNKFIAPCLYIFLAKGQASWLDAFPGAKTTSSTKLEPPERSKDFYGFFILYARGCFLAEFVSVFTSLKGPSIFTSQIIFDFSLFVSITIFY